MRPTLYIMAKAPVLGRAKSRLAADIGMVHAKRNYRAMMSRLLRQVTDPRWDTILSVTPVNSLGKVPDWDGFAQVPQCEGDLSPRIAELFQGKGPVMVIGTDCPQITRRDIADGFKALRSHKAVFGPSDDGGFWLIGMTAPVDPAIFYNVRWSHAETLADICQNVLLPIAMLRRLIDIDDLAALKQWRAKRY